MRKRKLQGGKQDIAGTKEDDSRTKDWIVELNAASRALAIRWLRAARQGLDGETFAIYLLDINKTMYLSRKVPHTNRIQGLIECLPIVCIALSQLHAYFYT